MDNITRETVSDQTGGQMAKTGGRKITAVTTKTTAAVKTAEITIAPITTTAEAREAVTTTDMEILATAAATSPAEMGPRTARAEAAIMAAREAVKMVDTTAATKTKTVEADSTVAQGLNTRPEPEADSTEDRHATRKTPAMEKRTCKRGNQSGGMW